METQELKQLPQSKLVKHQTRIYPLKQSSSGTAVEYTDEQGEIRWIQAQVGHDDDCGNGHNTFSITGSGGYRGRRADCFGCMHEDIAKHFPELAPYIRWHLTSTDGPLHYLANGKFWAGHSGFRDRKLGSPPNLEHLKSTIVYGALPTDASFDLADHLYSDERGFTWNEAKAQDLEEWLIGRLEPLMLVFKRDVESLGFIY